MPRRDNLDLKTGENLHYRGNLRHGDEVAVTEGRLLIRTDGELISVPYTNVSEIDHDSFDWFLAILSVSLTIFGIYFLSQNPLAAGFFTLAGVWSLYRTYRHRDLIRVHTHSQAKPIDIYPENVEAVYNELESAIRLVRTTRDESSTHE